ncbi:hypothetical protein [Vibrio owensii]|uniref:hypothetical protein n=1 Tax=Vibrio owensii TaxID=696485 RepID=UPI003CC5A49B
MKIGVCLFDEPSLASSGWASIGGKQAFRISSTSELRSDVLWVSNVSYKYYRKLNLIQTPNIVDEQFFRTKLSTLIQEISANDDPSVLASKSAEVLQRTADLGLDLLSVDALNSSYRYFTGLQDAMLTPEMREQPFGINSLDITDAIKQSTQENQAMSSQQTPRGSRAVPFVFPRGSYAKWLLSQKYPANNNWRPINARDGESVFGFEGGTKIRGTAGVIDKLYNLAENKAAMFRVAVLSTDPQYSGFAKFSAGKNGMIRRWATLPEIIEMSHYSKLAISGGYYTELSDLKLPDSIDLESDEFSFSRGLFYENLWVALSSAPYSKHGSNVSSIGAYMRAYDRIACGRAAASFTRYGFTVGSYGVGRLLVFMRTGEERTAREISLNLGLMPQMRIMEEA